MSTPEVDGTPRRRGRPRAFDETVALDAAMRLFWEHGYDGTSLADLTSAMGITPQSLYSAFGSKAELYQRTLQRYGDLNGAGMRDALALPHAVDATKATILRAAEQFSRRTWPHGCMVSSGEIRTAEDNADLGADLAARRGIARKRVEARLRQGLAEGDLRPGTDVPALARYVVTVIQGLSVQAADGASRPALRAVAELAATTLEAARRH